MSPCGYIGRTLGPLGLALGQSWAICGECIAWCNIDAPHRHMQLCAPKLRQSAHDHAFCRRCEMHVVWYMLYDQVDAILGVSWEDFVATWGYLGLWGHLGLWQGHLGGHLGRSWGVLGPTLGFTVWRLVFDHHNAPALEMQQTLSTYARAVKTLA